MLNTVESSETGTPLAPKRYGAPTVQSRLIGLVVLVILGVWLFFLYRHYLSDTPPAIRYTAQEKETADFIKQSYEKTGGQFNKLTEEEKIRFRRLAGIHAEEMFQSGRNIK